MGKCQINGCHGHLGKFADCLAETLWQAMLDGMDETTGSDEYEGTYTLMTFPEPEEMTCDGRSPVTVPAGNYVLRTNDRGHVWVETYDSASAALIAWEDADKRYAEWDDEQ